MHEECISVCEATDPPHRSCVPDIWDAARVLFGESNAKAESWVGDRLLALLGGRSGGEVARTIRWWAARAKKLGDSEHRAIEKTCDYLSTRTRARLLH